MGSSGPSLFTAYNLVPLIIMLVAGILGGYMNYFLTEEKSADTPKLGPLKSVVIGTGAALLVPLFLNMISSDLMNDVVGASGREPNFGKSLVFLGFCLVAAVSSRAFIQSLSERLLNEVKEKADAAQQKAQEAEAKAGEAETKADEVERLVTEPEQRNIGDGTSLNMESAEPIEADEKKILVALTNGTWLLRSTTGIANDARIDPDKIDSLLSGLEQRKLVGQRKSTGGMRWYITQAGKALVSPAL